MDTFMAGRRPKPTALKLVTGNPGRRPLNSAEPTPPLYSAPPPKHLSNTAKETWERLTLLLNSMGVLTIADAFALERLCDIYAEILRYRALIESNGETFEVHSQNGVLIKANPAVSMLSDADIAKRLNFDYIICFKNRSSRLQPISIFLRFA